MSFLCREALVQRKLVGIKVVHPGVDGALIVLALESSTIARPERAKRPSANLSVVALAVAGKESGVEGLGDDPLLDPVDHDLHVGLRERTRLESVGRVVGGAGNQEQLVPITHCGGALV